MSDLSAVNPTPPNRDFADDARMRVIVDRFGGPLKSYFRKRVYVAEEAEDLVQEVFCRIAAQGGAERMENPEAYIFQVAANLLRDRARRESTRASAMREIGHRTEDFVEVLSPERVLQGKQGLADLDRALTELPARTRIIFVLHRFEELKYSEIARRLDISVSGVEKHMMEAIRHLAARLGRNGSK